MGILGLTSIGVSIYLRVSDNGTYSINPVINIITFIREDANLKQFREKILPKLIEIQSKYSVSERTGGNFANIYLHYSRDRKQMTIEISDWVGALPDTVYPIKTYNFELMDEAYFTICEILSGITYVYTKEIPELPVTHDVRYPF